MAQLDNLERAQTVRLGGGRHTVENGPFVETKEWLVGFYLLDCENEEEAVRRAKMIATDGHAVEVRPVRWRWRG